MEKAFVKFLLEGKRYICKETKKEEMFILGLFLTDDVGCYNSWYKEWILDENQFLTGGNFSSVEKEDDYILISYEFELDGPYLKIHRDELIKILDTWEQFCKTKPKEIFITKEDDGTFKIEAKD